MSSNSVIHMDEMCTDIKSDNYLSDRLLDCLPNNLANCLRSLRMAGVCCLLIAAICFVPALYGEELRGMQTPSPLPNASQIGSQIGSQIVMIGEVTASAGAVDNWRNLEGSLKFESNRMLALAESKAAEILSSKGTEWCQGRVVQTIVFQATPSKHLEGYSDHAECVKLLRDTTAKPIVFAEMQTSSAAQFAAWFTEFSQGKGKEGKELYRKCPGSCSPQYDNYLEIEHGGKAMKVTSSVICGHARDKGDNTFKLVSMLKTECSPE